MPGTPSHQPPDPRTDGTFPDFPPRGDLQNTIISSVLDTWEP